MTRESPAEVAMWLTEPLSADVATALARLVSSDDVRRIAVMPDVHLAGDVCNGTVIATRDLIYPQAVGGDLGCGMLAVACDLSADVMADEITAGRVLAGLYDRIPWNRHAQSRCVDRLPEVLIRMDLSTSALEKEKSRDARFQFGTLGRGNHFIEFQSDHDGRLWLMIHSGSRAMGQAITCHHQSRTSESATGLGFLEAATEEGIAYLSDLAWAFEYAMQNRLSMARAVESLLRTLFTESFDWSTLIHSHHNHVRRERHGGEQLWVHRKGALPADDHEPGVIPGSMGTRSYHVSGRGVAAALRSSSHGAGRRQDRRQARRTITRRDLQQQMNGVWFDQRHSENLRDEAPAAYKDIGRIMRAQRKLTRIIRELKPVLAYKGL